MTLLVISHTAHYYKDGAIVGFGPTVREMDYMAQAFDKVIHIGCLYKHTPAPNSALPYMSKNVEFVPIPPYGGAGLKKFSIVTNAFKILGTVSKQLKKADVFQFRAPTSMGLYIIPYLTLFSNKKGWYKYAGNWTQPHPPLSYRLQKNWLLKYQNRPITINGKWPDQPAKCHTFENPCLNEADRQSGYECVQTKSFAAPFTLCFVGRVEAEKGIFSLLEALKNYPEQSLIGKLEIIGDGVGMEQAMQMVKELPFPVQVHGTMSRDRLFEIYKRSHFIVLPSKSEGFPKVIAEAANFGCIPVVSDVSCISQYINFENGFLWDAALSSFDAFFKGMDIKDPAKLAAKAARAHEFAGDFTLQRYVSRIQEEIING